MVINLINTIITNFEHLKEQTSTIEKIADTWINALASKRKIMFCGNGGSAADAQHLSAELIGRYKFDRPPFASISLTTDTSALTAIGNDYGYQDVFSRQVKGLGEKGDVLVGISTSGNSKNVIKAFEVAKELGVVLVAFTGANGGEMTKLADFCLNVPSTVTNNIQEMHIACGHILCDLVETHFFGK